MNNTTPVNFLDYFYDSFFNPLITIRFYQIGYSITFLLGFIGNTASLLTFSRSKLRKISTGCLFICLATSDILCLLMSVFDYIEFGFKVPLYRHVAYSELCRFRTFVMNVAQVASAWILVIVSIDRWIRTRFPFKSNSICTPKKVLIAVAMLIMIDIGLHSHILTPLFGISLPGHASLACGPPIYNSEYFFFYYLTWNIIQSYFKKNTFSKLKRAVIIPNQVEHGSQPNNRQGNIQNQMLIKNNSAENYRN
ncbi:hypothetical protein I4U23_015582 [Adineta vaga]|nr:hypothetical protein I4U23_015582 [Adineta vaga]